MSPTLAHTVLKTNGHEDDYFLIESDRKDAADLVNDPEGWFIKHNLTFPSQEQSFIFTFSWPHPDHPQPGSGSPEALIHIIKDNPSISVRFNKCIRDMQSDDSSTQEDQPPINVVMCGRERTAFCHHHFKDAKAARDRATNLVLNPFAFFRSLSNMPDTVIRRQTRKNVAAPHDRLGDYNEYGFVVLDTRCRFTRPEEMAGLDFVYETKFVKNVDLDLACSSCVRMNANAPYVADVYKMSVQAVVFKCWTLLEDPGTIFDEAAEAASVVTGSSVVEEITTNEVSGLSLE